MKLVELNEQGQALNDWVEWWKSASIEALEEAASLSEKEEDMVIMDDADFNKNMRQWHKIQTKIDYLDKDFKGKVSNYFLKKAFGGKSGKV